MVTRVRSLMSLSLGYPEGGGRIVFLFILGSSGTIWLLSLSGLSGHLSFLHCGLSYDSKPGAGDGDAQAAAS